MNKTQVHCLHNYCDLDFVEVELLSKQKKMKPDGGDKDWMNLMFIQVDSFSCSCLCQAKSKKPRKDKSKNSESLISFREINIIGVWLQDRKGKKDNKAKKDDDSGSSSSR